MMHIITQPWPWYIAGPLIGLTVPALLLIGNKPFGLSSTLKHICSACLPAKGLFAMARSLRMGVMRPDSFDIRNRNSSGCN